MGRMVRDTRLETREARSQLKARHEPYWRLIHEGLHLGYRKGPRGGVWLLRAYHNGKYRKRALGLADDIRDSEGDEVLNFRQAQERVIELSAELTGKDSGPYNVAKAVADYLEWYAANRKALAATRAACEAHILPALGDKQISELTARELRRWHESLAQAPARLRTGKAAKQQKFRQAANAEALRRRKATANRVLTILKAALNHAWRDHRVSSNDAWISVKPFRNVDLPKIRYLSPDETTRLINACAPDLRRLVTGALLTGCRYGELVSMVCADFNADAGAVLVRDSKSGRPRHVPLTDEGQRFFDDLTADQDSSARLFCKADGSVWGKSHQARPLVQACKVAKINPPASFHDLRHTYASSLAMRGVALQVIASALGHADTRITSRHYAHLMPSYVADQIRGALPSLGLRSGNVRKLRQSPGRKQKGKRANVVQIRKRSRT